MEKRAMLIDYGYCTGCHSCEVSCRKKNDLRLDEWGIKVNEVGPQKFSNGKWEWDFVPVPSSLCDLCEDRIAEGNKPLCELHCLANVIQIVPLDEVESTMEKLGKHKTVCYIP